MSRSGYPLGNMPSPSTNDAMAMKSTRRDSPVLAQDKTESGRSGLNSPIYPIHFQGPANTKGATPGLPSHQIHPGVSGGIQNGPLNGISGQLPLSAAQQFAGTTSRLASSTPPLPNNLNATYRPGSAPSLNSGVRGASPLYPSSANFTGPSLGRTQPPMGSMKPLSSLSGPPMPATNPHASYGVSSPGSLTTGMAPTYSRPPTEMSPNDPIHGQPPAQPGKPLWQGSLGVVQPAMALPTSQPEIAPPAGQVVGSSGQPLLPPMSQPPQPGQGTPNSGQVAPAPSSKRRLYPTMSQGSSFPGMATPQLPPSSMVMSPPAPHGAQPGPGQGLATNLGNQNPNQFTNSQFTNNQANQLSSQMGKLTVQQSDSQPINLLERQYMSPPTKEESSSWLPPDLKKKNADPSLLCCTLNTIPESHSLLQKCKLPFGILVHPFKDLASLPVIHSTTIVRCRSCRTYINPFVTFTEARRWRCNMCYRINEVSEDFCFDPQTKSYGEPTRRPEVKSATYEFIAPSEYMLRAPQPASYVFAFDVSFNAIETGYLKMACQIIKEHLDKIPSDSRALIGFLTFNKSVNFFNLRNDQSQPQMLIVSDVDDIFLPAPEDLLVNLKENKEMVIQFLDSLPETFASTRDIHSSTGAAMQAALKLLTATGGRITVFQTTLPSMGPGALENRDEPGVKSSPKDGVKLNPSTDFYKKLALDCAADQVSIDIFLLSAQYSDISSLMCASKYSGGCVSYFPNFHVSRHRAMVEKFENDLIRYLTRKIGFEAVMRVRCTKGLSIHTFHGNFFVRSTDLLSLPNVNPDAAFAMQISIEESLTDADQACFQSALLYTSSRGERRIRVHNLALPVTKKMSDVYAGANADAIALMLSKMAVDRTVTASLGDAREALINAIVDCLATYKSAVSGHSGQLLAPKSLRSLPLYILSLMKQYVELKHNVNRNYIENEALSAFRLGSTASLDSRCFAMQQFKVMPFNVALLSIYPALYSLHDMTDEGAITTKSGSVPQPPRLLMSGEKLSRVGIFLMDAGQEFFIWVGKETASADIQCLLGVPNYASIPEDMGSLPELDNTLSNRVRSFIDHLQSERTNHANLYILRDNSKMRMKFIDKLMNDRTESMMSYHEFLVHLQGQIN